MQSNFCAKRKAAATRLASRHLRARHFISVLVAGLSRNASFSLIFSTPPSPSPSLPFFSISRARNDPRFYSVRVLSRWYRTDADPFSRYHPIVTIFSFAFARLVAHTHTHIFWFSFNFAFLSFLLLIDTRCCDVSGNIKTKAVLDVESTRGYWLTVYAQDHGVVPLSSSLQVCPTWKRTRVSRVLLIYYAVLGNIFARRNFVLSTERRKCKHAGLQLQRMYTCQVTRQSFRLPLKEERERMQQIFANVSWDIVMLYIWEN